MRADELAVNNIINASLSGKRCPRLVKIRNVCEMIGNFLGRRLGKSDLNSDLQDRGRVVFSRLTSIFLLREEPYFVRRILPYSMCDTDGNIVALCFLDFADSE